MREEETQSKERKQLRQSGQNTRQIVYNQPTLTSFYLLPAESNNDRKERKKNLTQKVHNQQPTLTSSISCQQEVETEMTKCRERERESTNQYTLISSISCRRAASSACLCSVCCCTIKAAFCFSAVFAVIAQEMGITDGLVMAKASLVTSLFRAACKAALRICVH